MEKEEKYTITVNKRQLQLLSEAADVGSRCYRGIPETITLFDQILLMQYRGEGYPPELSYKRELLSNCLKQLRLIINQENRTDKTEQEAIMYDAHQVIRNALYKEQEDPYPGFE